MCWSWIAWRRTKGRRVGFHLGCGPPLSRLIFLDRVLVCGHSFSCRRNWGGSCWCHIRRQRPSVVISRWHGCFLARFRNWFSTRLKRSSLVSEYHLLEWLTLASSRLAGGRCSWDSNRCSQAAFWRLQTIFQARSYGRCIWFLQCKGGSLDVRAQTTCSIARLFWG